MRAAGRGRVEKEKKMRVQDMKVDDLIPYDGNPRKNEKAIGPVMESIKKFGFRVPLVVDEKNVVITGHTRLEAAKRLGLDTVPVIVAQDLDEEKARAFRLADNKTAEIAVWDFEKLEEELEDLDADEWLNRLFSKDMEDRDSVPKVREISLEEFGDEVFKYECEYCGFKFN